MNPGDDKEIMISRALQDAIKSQLRYYSMVDGVIQSVDESAFTCEVSVGDSVSATIFHNVPLRVLFNSQASVIEIPETGSNCIISFRDGHPGRPQLLMVDKTLKLLVNCSHTVFNGGNLGGMVKVIDLVSKLNTIENDLNNLKSLMGSWAPVPSDGGAALKSAIGSWAGKSISVTQQSEIENPDIKQ